MKLLFTCCEWNSSLIQPSTEIISLSQALGEGSCLGWNKRAIPLSIKCKLFYTAWIVFLSFISYTRLVVILSRNT